MILQTAFIGSMVSVSAMGCMYRPGTFGTNPGAKGHKRGWRKGSASRRPHSGDPVAVPRRATCTQQCRARQASRLLSNTARSTTTWTWENIHWPDVAGAAPAVHFERAKAARGTCKARFVFLADGYVCALARLVKPTDKNGNPSEYTPDTFDRRAFDWLKTDGVFPSPHRGTSERLAWPGGRWFPLRVQTNRTGLGGSPILFRWRNRLREHARPSKRSTPPEDDLETEGSVRSVRQPGLPYVVQVFARLGREQRFHSPPERVQTPSGFVGTAGARFGESCNAWNGMVGVPSLAMQPSGSPLLIQRRAQGGDGHQPTRAGLSDAGNRLAVVER